MRNEKALLKILMKMMEERDFGESLKFLPISQSTTFNFIKTLTKRQEDRCTLKKLCKKLLVKLLAYTDK